VTSVLEFGELCLETARKGDVSLALVSIQSFVWQAALSKESAAGQVFSSRALDEACQAIGALQPVEAPTEKTGVVYIVTELQLTGGHTRVVADLIAADKATARSGEPVTVLVTNVVRQHNPAANAILARLGAKVESSPVGDHAQVLAWLKMQLASLAPRITRLALHPFDSVAIAAVQPELTGELVFLHNADHNLALGVTLNRGLHVDFHAKGFFNCREREGVANNVMWPLTASDLGPRSPFEVGELIRTCTCGGAEKFEAQFNRDLAPYPHRYQDLAPLIPATTGGAHVHIGPLSAEALDAIGEGLDRLGVPRERFVHVPGVPSLWEALKALEIDLYISSFPLGGGRATVEALGAGLPICVHSNYRSIMFTPENEVYEGAFVWRTPKDLVACLSRLTEETLQRHARAARSYYEQNHHPSLLEAALAGQLQTPARPRHSEDRLQTYLDLSAARA
jgi:hypothetical protein